MAYVFAAVVEYAVANFIKKPEIDRLARRVFPISFSLLRKPFYIVRFQMFLRRNAKKHKVFKSFLRLRLKTLRFFGVFAQKHLETHYTNVHGAHFYGLFTGNFYGKSIRGIFTGILHNMPFIWIDWQMKWK